MKGFSIWLALGLSLLLSACSTSDNSGIETSQEWNSSLLEGTWVQTDEDNIFEETWWPSAEGVMEGVGYVLSAGDTIMIEHLRLEHDGEHWTYFAKVSDQSPEVGFVCTSQVPNKVVFENPKHNYPTSIIYEWQNLVQMKVTINGEIRGKNQRKVFVFLKEE